MLKRLSGLALMAWLLVLSASAGAEPAAAAKPAPKAPAKPVAKAPAKAPAKPKKK